MRFTSPLVTRSAIVSLSLAMTGAAALPASAQPYAIDWFSIDAGGNTTPSAGGTYTVAGTIGQSDASNVFAGGSYNCVGGFWAASLNGACYANCDASSVTPVLNANDFQCFLNKFAANDPYANCDGSTVLPVLNANDFQCFLNAFATGCP